MPLIHGQVCLHDNHILRPPNQENLLQNVRCSFIGPEKVPHPAEVPRRKPRVVGILGSKIFRSRHCRSFFLSDADQFSNFEIQLHLRQVSFQCLIQSSIHCTVINGPPDVHGLLLSGAIRLFRRSQQREMRHRTATLLFAVNLYNLHGLFPEQDMFIVDCLIVVVVPEQPVMIPGLFLNLLKEIRERISLILTVYR